MRVLILSLFLIMLLNVNVSAQNKWSDLIAEQQILQKRSMVVLGSWGLANVAVGGIGLVNSEGSTKHFHQMNLGWGVINTGLALSGYLGARNYNLDSPKGMSLLQKNLGMSKAFLFNAGLDVGYVMGGLYLRERAKNDPEDLDRLTGFGNSIMIQGAFLFGFDLVAYFLNNQKTKKINNMMLQLGGTGQGLGLSLRF